MQHDRTRTRRTLRTAVLACVATLALAFAGPANAVPENLTEHAGDQPTPALPPVGDRPADRVLAPADTVTQATSTSADDGNSNAPLIVGLSLATVALLGSGTYVVLRHRRLAPGH